MKCKKCKFYRYFLGLKPFVNKASWQREELFDNSNYLWCEIYEGEKNTEGGIHISRSYPAYRSFEEAHIQMASDCASFFSHYI